MPELSPDLFNGTWDSDWWEVKRGKPPLYVIIGVWVVDLYGAIAGGLLAGFVTFGGMLFVSTWLGAIDRYESDTTPGIIWCGIVGAGVAMFVGRRSIRHAIQTTRLFLRLSQHTNEEVERALKRYKRRSRKRKRKK